MFAPLLVAALLLPSPASPEAPPAGAPAPQATPSRLERLPQVRVLCDALTPEERFAPKGDAVARARASREHAAGREAALDGRYDVTLAGDGLRFATYEPEEGRLALSDRSLLTAAGGSLRLWTTEDAGLPVTADEAAARRILEAQRRRTLSLSLVFVLPEDGEEAVCSHAEGALSYTLGVEPVSWRYLDAGAVLARGGEGSDRPPWTVADGARPRVEIAEPLEGGDPSVQAAVRAHAGGLERCYEGALKSDPGLDGALVADLDFTSGGVARAVHIALDSVQHEGLVTCVRDVLTRVALAGSQGQRAAIPIHFALEPPAGASGEGAGGR
jgi:hypothetical protein